MTDQPQTRQKPVSASSNRGRAMMAMLAALLCLAVRWPFLTTTGFIHDQVVFMHWASQAERGGIQSVFALRPNGKLNCPYPPLYPVMLRTLASAYRMGTGHSIEPATINDVVAGRVTPQTAAASALFKMPGVIADALTSALLMMWLSRRLSIRASAAVSLFYAITPAVAFNSAVWGQIDSISTLFTLVALESLTRRRWLGVGVFAALGILTKPQAMLFVPVFGMAALITDRGRSVSAVLRVLLGGLMAVGCVILPLWSVRGNVARAYFETTDLYPLLHLNGFSAWFLANPITEPRLEELSKYYRRDDQVLTVGITPKQAGLASLIILGAAVLIRIIRLRANDESIRFAACVLPLAFMVLCTQMHERYLVPAIAFWAWAFQPSLRWWIGWFIIGAVAIVNLFWVWTQPMAFDALASFADWTREAHGGIATGVYCAIALLAALLISLAGLDRGARSGQLSA